MAVTNQLEIDIKAKSQKATDSLDALISKLNEVNTALNGLNTAKISEISNSIKGVKGVHLNTGGSGGGSNGNGDNNGLNRTNTLLKLFTKTTNGTTGSILNFRGAMLKMAATWGTFYAAMYPAMRLFGLLKDSAEDSMDYIETYNYFKVVMNKLGHDSGKDFSEGFIAELDKLNRQLTGYKLGKNGELFETGEKSLGLDPKVIMNFQAQIGAVANSVGMFSEMTVATQKAMTMLTADYTSLRNFDLKDVMTNFSSALIGQSRAVYKYGLDLTQASLKQVAYAHGISKSVSAMTQAEKMQLRVLEMLERSKVTWTDQIKTINTAANQYRMLKQQLTNLSRVLGNLFLPIIKTVLPYVNALVITLKKVFTLLGFKAYGGTWLEKLNEDLNEGDFSGLNEEIDDTEEALDGATKAAKKFKQATMGFDELNIISPETSSGSGSGSGGGGASFDLTDDINEALGEYEKKWNEAFKKMQNKSEELANKFMSYVESKNWFGLGDWIGTSLTNNLAAIPWNTVYQGAKNFGSGLAQFLNGLISPELFYQFGRTTASALNTALYFALDFGKEFDGKNLGKSIGSGINGFFETYDFSSLAETLNVWVDNLEDAFVNAISTIKWNKVIKGALDFGTHLDFDTIAIVLGAITISKIGKVLMNDIVKEMIIKKIAETIVASPINLGGALKVTGGVAFTVKGLTMIFDSMQNGDLMEGLWGSLLTTGGVALLSGGSLMITVPTLIVSIGAVSFAWLQTPDAETGYKGLNKILGKIKFGKEATTFDGETIEVKVSLKEKIKQFNVDWQNTIYDAQKEFDRLKTNLKATWGELSLDIGVKIESIKDAFQIKWDEFSQWWDITLPQWYNNNVKTWFSKEKWQETGSGIKDGLSIKWTEFSNWWKNTGFAKWWDEDVSPWFTLAKWQELGQGIHDGLTNKWNEFTEWWKTTGIYTWWTEHVEPFFDENKWTFDGIAKGLKASFGNAIKGVKQLWNDFADWINENLSWDVPSVNIGDKTIGGYHIQLGKLPKFNIPQYAIGGFPEDGLFMANHTELVGQFSNGQTAVANNEQIVEGIRSGVASAVAQTLAPYLREIASNTGDTAANTDAIAKKPVQTLTDRGIAKANIRGQRSLGLQLRTT